MRKPSVFLGLREGVRRFFAFDADRVAAAENIASPPPPDGVSAGRFGLIGLAELRESMGPRWPALEERVRALAEAVIAHHLTTGDVFERQDDGSYVVLFAGLNKEEADFKCRLIGREISDRLLGSDSPRLADVESVSTEVARKELASGDLDVVFAEAFACGTVTISSDPASPRPASDAKGAAVPRWRTQTVERELRSTTLRPVDHAVQPSGLPSWQDLEAPERAAQPMLVAAEHQKARRARHAWRYTPIWDFKNMSLVRFRLTASSTAPAEEGRENESPAHEAGFELDLRTVSKALDDLAVITGEGRRLSVVCVIHQTSLGVEWRRDQLLDLLGRASPEIRRLLRVEVFSPTFTPALALARFVEGLDTLGIHAAAGVRLDSREPVRAAGMRLKTAAAEVTLGAGEAHAIALLNTFARRSAQVGLESAAHGLDSRSLVIGAIAAGVRFLSGHAVHPDISDLNKGLRFEASDLYRDLLVGRSA